MGLNVKSVECLQDHIAISADKDCCTIPLFHGTRMHALEVNKEDRQQYYDACDKVIKFAKELWKQQAIDYELLEEYQRNKNRYSLYQYGEFYVTTGYPNAITYTKNASGELGEWAYRQCIGFKDFEITLSKDVMTAVKIVETEYKKYANSERVILVYTNVKYEDLLTDRGETFLRTNENGEPDELYNKFHIDGLYKRSASSQRAYRVVNPESYTATIVREKDFDDGFAIFTEIKNETII